MGKSFMKMAGLAAIMLSVFAILFGVHAGEAGAPGPVGAVLVFTGLALLLGGSIFYVVVRDD